MRPLRPLLMPPLQALEAVLVLVLVQPPLRALTLPPYWLPGDPQKLFPEERDHAQ